MKDLKIKFAVICCISAFLFMSIIQLSYGFNSPYVLFIVASVFFIEHLVLLIGGLRSYNDELFEIREVEIKNIELTKKLYDITQLCKRLFIRARESPDVQLKEDLASVERVNGGLLL